MGNTALCCNTQTTKEANAHFDNNGDGQVDGTLSGVN